MSKAVRPARKSGLFLDSAHCAHASVSGPAPKGFIHGIVDGERVLVAQVEPETEKGIEIRIRVALASAGVMVMKHHVDNSGQKPCDLCGHRSKNRGARTGLGIGVSDLICVVPPFGRFLGIEVKKPGQKPRDEQKRWLAVIRRHGGVTGVATTVEEAMALVAEARRMS